MLFSSVQRYAILKIGNFLGWIQPQNYRLQEVESEESHGCLCGESEDRPCHIPEGTKQAKTRSLWAWPLMPDPTWCISSPLITRGNWNPDSMWPKKDLPRPKRVVIDLATGQVELQDVPALPPVKFINTFELPITTWPSHTASPAKRLIAHKDQSTHVWSKKTAVTRDKVTKSGWFLDIFHLGHSLRQIQME